MELLQSYTSNAGQANLTVYHSTEPSRNFSGEIAAVFGVLRVDASCAPSQALRSS